MSAEPTVMPFKVGDRVRMVDGWRPSLWRPDSNHEVKSRFATVVKVSGDHFWIKPDQRIRHVKLEWEDSRHFLPVDKIFTNIQADWLEENATAENGFQTAADALRKAFPLKCDG